MADARRLKLSAKDEALLVLEYLENERMCKTFLNFLDESQHLSQLRTRLYANYENCEQFAHETDLEAIDFQEFFNLSKQNGSSLAQHSLTLSLSVLRTFRSDLFIFPNRQQ